MESENVFSKLRRIAKYVQNETALAQERMSRPSALRSSGDSARPVLRKMLCDVHNIKLESEEELSRLPSTSEFNELLDACNQLCIAYRSKVDELENYLHQYGYQQPTSTKDKATSRGKKGSLVKAPVPAEGKTASPDAEESWESTPTTPAKDGELASSLQSDGGAGTPRLEDYGLSRDTMNMLVRKRCQPGQHQPSAQQGRQGGVDDTRDFPDFQREPFTANTPLQPPSQVGTCPFTPLGVTTTPTRFAVTPGLFGGGELPNETPMQFIDIVSQRGGKPGAKPTASSAAKSLHFPPSSNKSVAPSILDAFPSHLAAGSDAEFGTPPAPELTARWAFTSIHQPPPKPNPALSDPLPVQGKDLSAYANKHPNTNTPPTPEMTTRWQSRTTSVAPQASERLAAQMSPMLMDEPVLLAMQDNHTPEEPQRLAGCDTVGSPSRDSPATPPGLMGNLGRGRAFDFSQFLSDDMPKTPELTMSYSRYVDSVTKPTPQLNGSVRSDITQKPSAPRQENTPLDRMDGAHHATGFVRADVSCPTLAPVLETEFLSQSDYLRRILSLELINKTVSRINGVLKEKATRGEGAFLTDSDIQRLDLGAKSKVMLLFLIKLQRISNSKTMSGSEATYYPSAV